MISKLIFNGYCKNFICFLGISKPDDIDSTQKAVNHLATVTLENHTSVAGFHWRYIYNMPEFYEKLCEPYYGKSKALAFFRYGMPYTFVMKTKMHGLGKETSISGWRTQKTPFIFFLSISCPT